MEHRNQKELNGVRRGCRRTRGVRMKFKGRRNKVIQEKEENQMAD